MSSAAFSREIRQAAGYGPPPDAAERPVGAIGVGRGGSARPRRVEPPSMSGMIRAAIEMRRSEMFSLGYYFDDVQRAAEQEAGLR